MNLSRFPRVRLAHLPTPLEFMPRLTEHLKGPRLFIKRDDCTGLASGGNKTRKLEFLMAEAMAQKADVVITVGAVQSNHARQTAAAAAKLGLQCEILLEQRIADADDEYRESGNVLLDRLLGADIVAHLPAGSDMQAALDARADELRKTGRRPYAIPGGGSNPVGALGYVQCALELLDQANNSGLRIDAVAMASGSAGTQAGLVAGLWGSRSGIPVQGFSVSRSSTVLEESVYQLTISTLAHLGISDALPRNAIVADDAYVGKSYGVPTAASLEAIDLMARLEGILIDPVYTSKGMAGMIDYVRNGRYNAQQNIVFLHSGGSAGLFAYRSQLSAGRQFVSP